MFCSKCGHEITGTIKFCPKCGTPVPQAEAAPVEEPTPAVEETDVEETKVEEPVVEEAPVEEAPVEETPVEEVASEVEETVEEADATVADAAADETPIEDLKAEYSGDAPTEELKPEDAPTAESFADPGVPADYYQAPVGDEPKKKKFNKVWLIVVLAVILVGAAVAAIFLNFRAAFSNPKTLMKNALVNYVDDTFDKNDAFYKQNTDEAVLDASITLEDGIREALDMTGEDFDWIETAHLRAEVGTTDTAMGMNFVGGLNGTDIVSMVYLLDMEAQTGYFQFPELSKEYLGFDMSEIDDEVFEQALASMNSLSGSEAISNSDLQKLAVKYTKLIAGELGEVDKDKDELEVDGVSNDYYVLTATLDQKTTAAMAVAVGEEIKDDKELKELLRVGYASFASSMSSYGSKPQSFDDWYDDFLDEVEDMVKEQKKALKNYDKYDEGDEELAELIVYVNMKGELKGIELTPSDADGKLYAYYPEDGDEFGMEIGFTDGYDEYILTGSGTNSHDIINGVFTVEIEGEELAEIEVIDYDRSEYEKGHLVGEFVVRPGSDISGGYDMASQMLSSMEYDMVFNSTKDEANCAITIKNDTVSFATINMTITYQDVDVPSTPNKYYDVDDYEQLDEYYETISLDEVISRLRQAGVPSDIMDELEQSAEYMF